MNSTLEVFLPILFKVLLGFISLNIIINLILLYTERKKMYKLLTMYWPSVLLVFFLQSLFQKNQVEILYSWSLSYICGSIFAALGFEAIGLKFPLKKYLIIYGISYPISYGLYHMGYGFTVFAMPISLAAISPLLETFYRIHFSHRDKTTRLQKVLGIISVLQSIHAVNFSFFRMDQDAQLWGWLVAYAIYDALAILLPAIALEKASLTEKERLTKLVEDKTAELNASLKDKDHLLKVLLHDISGPLMVSRFYLTKIEATSETQYYLERVLKSKEALEHIIMQVKELYGQKYGKGQISLRPVDLEGCISEASFLFSQKLEKKNISLSFNNKLAPNTLVLAEKVSLTHSVISNLISNGVKFSQPNSEIEIIAEERDGSVILEVRDRGPGISSEVIEKLMTNNNVVSQIGTEGEQGSGFGLSIVKSFVEAYGGGIEFDSKYIPTHPQDHGTNIRITLDRA